MEWLMMLGALILAVWAAIKFFKFFWWYENELERQRLERQRRRR